MSGQSFRASERPPREAGSEQVVRAGGLSSIEPLPSKGGSGESIRTRPGNLFATLGAVHAGGERGCESGHLEPFFFKSVLPRIKSHLTKFSMAQSVSVCAALALRSMQSSACWGKNQVAARLRKTRASGVAPHPGSAARSIGFLHSLCILGFLGHLPSAWLSTPFQKFGNVFPRRS
jgi:hypothetical protein